jgi:hypothetical protein
LRISTRLELRTVLPSQSSSDSRGGRGTAGTAAVGAEIAPVGAEIVGAGAVTGAWRSVRGATVISEVIGAV